MFLSLGKCMLLYFSVVDVNIYAIVVVLLLLTISVVNLCDSVP